MSWVDFLFHCIFVVICVMVDCSVYMHFVHMSCGGLFCLLYFMGCIVYFVVLYILALHRIVFFFHSLVLHWDVLSLLHHVMCCIMSSFISYCIVRKRVILSTPQSKLGSLSMHF